MLSAPSSLPCYCALQGMEVQMVLELCNLGSLRSMLEAGLIITHDVCINYPGLLEVASGIAKGMLHLHKLNILHGDLKAQNVLLRSANIEPCGVIPKLADFGLSVQLSRSETHVSSLCQGTPTHMAPEVLLSGRQSRASDV
jgi:serine/threonine protein kinase